MKPVFVLYGGISVEHEVSIRSAKMIINTLDKKIYEVIPVFINKEGHYLTGKSVTEEINSEEELIFESSKNKFESIAHFLTHEKLKDSILFPVLHGTYGEDGVLQGFLEIIDRPYVGDGVLASSVCMDKGISNDLFEMHQIPQAKYIVCEKGENYSTKEIVDHVSLPCYVKPCNSGSSVGVTKVEKEENLLKAMDYAFIYDKRIVIEEGIVGDELQIAVLGNQKALASRPGVYGVSEGHDFFDYEAKYNDESTLLQIPYDKMCSELESEARKLAEKAYKITTCNSYARVDIFVEKDTNRLLVNEINTAPGMTKTSMFPQLWSVTKELDFMEPKEVLNHLIRLAEENYQAKKAYKKTKE